MMQENTFFKQTKKLTIKITFVLHSFHIDNSNVKWKRAACFVFFFFFDFVLKKKVSI